MAWMPRYVTWDFADSSRSGVGYSIYAARPRLRAPPPLLPPALRSRCGGRSSLGLAIVGQGRPLAYAPPRPPPAATEQDGSPRDRPELGDGWEELPLTRHCYPPGAGGLVGGPLGAGGASMGGGLPGCCTSARRRPWAHASCTTGGVGGRWPLVTRRYSSIVASEGKATWTPAWAPLAGASGPCLSSATLARMRSWAWPAPMASARSRRTAPSVSCSSKARAMAGRFPVTAIRAKSCSAWRQSASSRATNNAEAEMPLSAMARSLP